MMAEAMELVAETTEVEMIVATIVIVARVAVAAAVVVEEEAVEVVAAVEAEVVATNLLDNFRFGGNLETR